MDASQQGLGTVIPHEQNPMGNYILWHMKVEPYQLLGGKVITDLETLAVVWAVT